MATTYRPPSTKVIPPAPADYRENFERGGWRLVERLYGARTDLHLKWQQENAGLTAKPLRRYVQVMTHLENFRAGLTVGQLTRKLVADYQVFT